MKKLIQIIVVLVCLTVPCCTTVDVDADRELAEIKTLTTEIKTLTKQLREVSK